MFTVSQIGDLPLFLFIFILLARTGTTELAEILPALTLISFEYILIGPLCLHLNAVLGLCLQVAVFLKAAQWVFYP